MPKFVIERSVHGVGSMSPEQIQAISQKSCSVLRDLGPQIQWLQSFVTDNKIYCVYIAPNEEMVREHARQGGFPVTASHRLEASSIPHRQKPDPARVHKALKRAAVPHHPPARNFSYSLFPVPCFSGP